MTETADKYADLAKTAGASAGLTQEQIPGLAHILRELARSERAEQKEACARVAEDFEAQVRNKITKTVDMQGDFGAIYASKRIAAAIRGLE